MMHHFIPTTDKEELKMLEEMQFSSFEELISFIPDSFLNTNEIGLGKQLTEMEVERLLKGSAFKNHIASDGLCFLGGGSYDHFIPKVVDTLSSRSEFYTAYTPYQPEVSQGTLQYLYEFQSMICELTGMDVSNASLYDGASAVAEACSMALSITKKNVIALSKTLNPNYINVVKTYLSHRNCKIILINESDGYTDLTPIQDGDIACIVIQSPNYFGLIEDWIKAKSIANDSNALLVAVSDPSTLSVLKTPGNCGVDIYAGEGQSLGNYMSYGGPCLGLLASKEKYIRNIPGRIVGKTTDIDGKVGYTLTLQTREQHIRRENATSNICTNQSLLALRTTIYLSLAGKYGLAKLNKLCYNKSQYAYAKLISLNSIHELYDRNFIKEFCVKTEHSASKLKLDAEKENIFIGILENDTTDSILQVAVTERRTIDDIDKLYHFLKAYKQ